MQELFEALQPVLREAGMEPMGTRGAFVQHREPHCVELVDHIAHSLVVAAQLASNFRGSFPTRRGSQNLAAAHHKVIGGTKSRLDLMLFVLGQKADKNGCSHTWWYTTLPTTLGGIALGYVPYSVLHGSLFFSNSLVHLGRYPVLFNLLFFFFLACLVGAQVYRYRRVSTAVQRQQTKWVVFATAVTILVGLGLIGPALLLPSLSPPYILLAETVSTLFAPIIPISVGMAILRYRLWEIDTIINKALVYSTLTATLAVIYAGLVIGLQALLRGIIGQDNSVAIVISTLAIAALFQPLRHRLQKLIDRRFYRSKYDAAKIIEAFSATLRNEVALQH